MSIYERGTTVNKEPLKYFIEQFLNQKSQSGDKLSPVDRLLRELSHTCLMDEKTENHSVWRIFLFACWCLINWTFKQDFDLRRTKITTVGEVPDETKERISGYFTQEGQLPVTKLKFFFQQLTTKIEFIPGLIEFLANHLLKIAPSMPGLSS